MPGYIICVINGEDGRKCTHTFCTYEEPKRIRQPEGPFLSLDLMLLKCLLSLTQVSILYRILDHNLCQIHWCLYGGYLTVL